MTLIDHLKQEQQDDMRQSIEDKIKEKQRQYKSDHCIRLAFYTAMFAAGILFFAAVIWVNYG